MQRQYLAFAFFSCLSRADPLAHFTANVTDPNVKGLHMPPGVENDMLGFQYGDVEVRPKAAVFDLDGTLTNPLVCSAKYCPPAVWKGYREWQFTFPNAVLQGVRKKYKEGFQIVIVSNQDGLVEDSPIRSFMVGRDVGPLTAAQKRQQWYDKMVEFSQLVNGGATGKAAAVPMQVFALLNKTKGSEYYKPCAGFWRTWTSAFRNGSLLDCSSSFYCGDAGGRLRGDTSNPWQNGTDAWSSPQGVHYVASDRQFAFSAGVRYHTPEEIFMNAAPPKPSDYNAASFEGQWCDRQTAKKWCMPAKG